MNTFYVLSCRETDGGEKGGWGVERERERERPAQDVHLRWT